MIDFGINLRDAIREAERLGVTVENVHRTGEVRFRWRDRAQIQNARRKDASVHVVRFLRKVAKEAGVV